MPLSRRSAVGLVVMNALALTAGAPGQTQTQKPTTGNTPSPQAPTLPDITGGREMEDTGAGPMHERMRITAEKAHNNDRRKRMLADTDRLLALSTELKADIEKATKDELSLEVIRKAGEIEKLAHDVQQRMKN